MATVTTCFGALSTMPRTSAESSPDFSATPTPRGAKLTKLLTRLPRIRRRPSPLSRLTASIVAPAAAAGRGSSTLTPSQPNRPDRNTISVASSANSVTGWGRRLPSHSTTSRNRVNQLRFCAAAAGVGSLTAVVLGNSTAHHSNILRPVAAGRIRVVGRSDALAGSSGPAVRWTGPPADPVSRLPAGPRSGTGCASNRRPAARHRRWRRAAGRARSGRRRRRRRRPGGRRRAGRKPGPPAR